MRKQYLGDSVYAEFDGFAIILMTDNGLPDDPRNRIVIEPDVYRALTQYVDRLNLDGLTSQIFHKYGE